MNKILVLIVVILILLLYIVSAFNKITHFNSVSDSLKSQLEKNIIFKHIQNKIDLSKIGLVIAILLLVSGSVLMLYGIYDNYYLKIGSLILLIFVIIATFLYHPPNDPNELNNFLKNLSLMGGLGFIIIRDI
jgi:uncharacterized membrane protein YphA (DoxX/SURF4 family)